VQAFAAQTPEGTTLTVEKRPNHWVSTTNGAPTIIIQYKLLCTSRFVTGSARHSKIIGALESMTPVCCNQESVVQFSAPLSAGHSWRGSRGVGRLLR
jgi:hypothetical protein